MLRKQFSKHSLPLLHSTSSRSFLTTPRILRSFSTSSSLIRSRENVDEAYAQMHAVIKEGVEVAAVKKKKPLVIAGEHHYNPEELPLQMMVLTIAKDPIFNFNDLFIEHTAKHLNEYINKIEVAFKKDPDAYFDNDHGQIGCMNMIESYVFLKDKLNMHAHGMDLPDIDDFRSDEKFVAYFTTVEAMNKRDNYMANQLIRSNVNALAFVGMAHMKGIMTNTLLLEQYHPIAFNISMAGMDANLLKFVDTINLNERYRFALDSKQATQVLPKMSFFANEQRSIQSVIKYCEDKLDEYSVASRRLGN
jgi:hypothetical protein